MGALFPSHLGSLGAWGSLGRRWHWHLFTNLASGYGRTLLVLNPRVWSLTSAEQVSARTEISGRLRVELLPGVSLSLTGRNILAHAFGVDGLQGYPQGSGATPVGTTVLAGVQVGDAGD